MNVKDYIESGILEAYILGTLQNGEMTEVEANIAKYPELANEVAAIELAMQRFAETFAKEPPADMQDKIWNNLQGKNIVSVPDNINTPIARLQETKEATETKVIPLAQPLKEMPATGWQRAAVWIALVGSMIVNFVLWGQRHKMMDDQVATHQAMDSMQQQQTRLAALTDTYQKEIDIMSDSSVHTIVLKSLHPNHPMVATVYWSSYNGATYLTMQKLPMPPKGMQYQMWVIQDGKPVSMGVLPNSMITLASVKKLPMGVKTGQAFAISLEKEGGSPTPTAENIYVMGKVVS